MNNSSWLLVVFIIVSFIYIQVLQKDSLAKNTKLPRPKVKASQLRIKIKTPTTTSTPTPTPEPSATGSLDNIL
jgi:hypothetical protein